MQVYFAPDEVHAAIVTCGGLCPGLNTVIREIVCALYHMYGVTKVLGIDVSLFLNKYIEYIVYFKVLNINQVFMMGHLFLCREGIEVSTQKIPST